MSNRKGVAGGSIKKPSSLRRMLRAVVSLYSYIKILSVSLVEKQKGEGGECSGNR